MDVIIECNTCFEDKVRDFISMMWACWSLRSEFIFRNGNPSASRARSKVAESIKDYSDTTNHFKMPWESLPSPWKVLNFGLFKVNFDVGKLGAWSKGEGVAGTDSSDVRLFAAVKQSSTFTRPEMEKVK